MLGIFFKDKHEYTNSLDPVQGYLEQLTFYIQTQKQISKEEATVKAKEVIRKHFNDKEVTFFSRGENGDRTVEKTTLLSYIDSNLKSKNVLVPTFTSYTSTDKKKSVLSEFILENVKRRGVAKKASQKAKAEGNNELADSKNNEQNMMKLYNNSLSGAFAQEACILHNPTAHSTLTSTTRTITSLSNASNEKLISGNRYYPRSLDVLNNIIYISTYANIHQLQLVIDKYKLHIPTVSETVNVLKYSSDLYFSDKLFYENKVVPYLSKLSSYHLAAICYIGDLYHIRYFNDNFTNALISELIKKINVPEPATSSTKELHSINENILNFVHHIFYSKVKGLGKDYDKMHEEGFAGSLYATCKNVENTLFKYKDFFNCFFMTDIMPNNSFRLKHMNRRTVVLSDTDSTCFTLDEWAKWWHNGKFIIDDTSIAVTGCVAFIAGQAIVNQLAYLSRNMNITDEYLNTLALKNEFLWLVHAPCEISKHYFAYTVIQEGNVFKSPDLEVKGVHLKNSAIPKFVIQDAKNLMEYILSSVSSNQKVKFNYVLDNICNLEANIKKSVFAGEAVYLKKSKIKNAEAYALEWNKSPYIRHVFWQEVFAPKYGQIQEPPYDVIKIPTVITSTTALADWVDSISDLDLRNRLLNWLTTNDKKDLPTIYLSETYIAGSGIPEEILNIIDVKKIILDVTIQHRVILETLGIMLYDDSLVSEQFKR